jgi:MSHA biogenesis protein MshM
MPFLNHFSLKEYPFALTPNTDLFYPLDASKGILASLEFALDRGDGLLKVVGEVGSGKTLLCRLLLERLDEKGHNTAYVNSPVLEAKQLPAAICRELGFEPSRTDPYRDLRQYLLRQHEMAKRTILVIDEAQALGEEGLEIIRLLSNLETTSQKLLQIVLFGQAELDTLLAKENLRQVAQRIPFAFTTHIMNARVTMDYIRFRLDKCSAAHIRRDVFDNSALHFLARRAKGLPRVIHILADKSLLAAYADGAPAVGRRHVAAAIRESSHIGLQKEKFLGLF